MKFASLALYQVVSKVKRLFEKIQDIGIPMTREVSVSHGAYGRYTRYAIAQHEYAGGPGGFVEVLEIENPPDERCGNVIHEYSSNEGSIFHEFKSPEGALSGWKKLRAVRRGEWSEEDGFIRSVSCGMLDPWFYAIADQALWEDFAFPSRIADDPIFRPSRKFVVTDYGGNKEVKTCMWVTRRKHEHYPSGGKYESRVILWSDGTEFDEHSFSFDRIKPLEESELWIQEAYRRIRDIFNEKLDKVTVLLDDRVITISVGKRGTQLDLAGDRVTTDKEKWVIKGETEEEKKTITGDKISSAEEEPEEI